MKSLRQALIAGAAGVALVGGTVAALAQDQQQSPPGQTMQGQGQEQGQGHGMMQQGQGMMQRGQHGQGMMDQQPGQRPDTMGRGMMGHGGMMGRDGMMRGGMMGMMGHEGMRGGGGMAHGGMMRIMFAVMDADGDGALALQEVQEAHARIFRHMDADDDDRVTPEEIHAFFGRSPGADTQE